MTQPNNRVILIAGLPSNGKTSSLEGLNAPEDYIMLNCDRKPLPFANQFRQNIYINDPREVLTYLPTIEASDKVEGIIIDTMTDLMNMFEQIHVNTSANIQQAWGDYGTFYHTMMNQMKQGQKTYIFTTHIAGKLNEEAFTTDYRAPVKGAVGKRGIEADFSIIVSAKQVPLSVLEGYDNEYLNITDEDREMGMKYVFQTRINKSSVGDMTRSPRRMWSIQETYIDNNVQYLLDRINKFYGE